MESNTQFIKNMVCPRCLESVGNVYEGLGLSVKSIELGKVETNTELKASQKKALNDGLSAKGFELLEEKNSKLIGQIKAMVVKQIHYPKTALNVNFSTLLSEELNQEYSSLSRLFSSVEGITIESFILKQKIEKVKEFIFYKELTLSEIAFQMNYSSVAHLSAQFKKETGMSPSAFKKLDKPVRFTLDSF